MISQLEEYPEGWELAATARQLQGVCEWTPSWPERHRSEQDEGVQKCQHVPGPPPVAVTRGDEVVCTSGVGMWDRRAVSRACLGPDHGVPCFEPFLAVGHRKDHCALTRGLS